MRPLEPGTGGVVAVLERPSGKRMAISWCASCGLVRAIVARGLCDACHRRHRWDGTLEDFGYTRASRIEDYAFLRAGGQSAEAARARVGVSERTALRYEAALREAP
jgi:hypothetical protein